MDSTPQPQAQPQAQPPAQPQPSPKASRTCQIHGIVLGPFGRCVICQRAESDEPEDPSGGRAALGVLLLLVTALGCVLAYRGVSSPREAPVVTAPPGLPAAAAAAEREEEEQVAVENERAAAHVKATTEEQQRAFAAALHKVPVSVYTTRGCETCGVARDWLKSKQLDFTDLDVEASPERPGELRALNPGFTVPTFVVDGEVFVGFAPAAIQSALLRAAQKRVR